MRRLPRVRARGRGRGFLAFQPSHQPLRTASSETGERNGSAENALALAGNPTPSSSAQAIAAAGEEAPNPAPVLPAIPNNFKLDGGRSFRFSVELGIFCARWAAQYVPQHGIQAVMNLLVDKIFQDNEGRYNLFLLEATICTTSTLGSVWVGPSTVSNLTGLRFRHMFQMGGNHFVIFIFDQSPTVPLIEFSLEYMHPKYRREQLAPEIVAKASASCRSEVGTNTVLLRSTQSDGAYFSYHKNYLFHHGHERFQSNMSTIFTPAVGN